MNRSNRRIFEKSIILILSATFSLFIYISLINLLSKDFTNRLNEKAGILLERVQLVNIDIIKTLNSLNALKTTDCDDDLLKELRQRLFYLRHVQDIGYFNENKLVCSTGLGIINPAIESENPDFIGMKKAEIWIDPQLELFQRKTPSIVIRINKFNAVLSKESLSDLFNIKYDWQLLLKRDYKTIHLAGVEGLLESAEGNPEISQRKFIVNVCAKNQSYCIAISASNKDFIIENRSAIYIISGLSVILFLFLFLFSNIATNRYYSYKSRILRGLRKNSFYCHYQPIVKMDSREITGLEVLARFKDNIGEIFPDIFIPVIVQEQITWQFTKLIIRKSMADLEQLRLNIDHLRININFFPQDIDSKKILELVNAPIKSEKHIKLVIEITENAQLTSQNSKFVLEELVKSGFEIAIDDFGTGYSNLSQLIDFKCHTLKIDRSFISEMEDGAIRASLIPHIMNIANDLNLKVVAEGVENNDQLRHLQELGIQYGQGYLFSRPIGVEKLSSLLNQSD